MQFLPDPFLHRSHLVGLNGTLSARAFDTRVPRSFSISPERHRDRNVSLYSSRCISTTPGQIGTLNYCEGDFKAEQMIQSKITTVVLAIFFVSLLGVGMGQTAVYTLGIPYIDDNVASRESPLYFGELMLKCLLFSFLYTYFRDSIEFY